MKTIVIILLAIILLFITIKKNRNGYSLIQALFSFKPIKEIYKHLSSEKKTSFWTIMTSVLVAILTAWIGFTVQFTISNNIQESSEKVAHYQVVDKCRPIYNDFYDSITTKCLTKTFLLMNDSKNYKKQLDNIKNELENLSKRKSNDILLYIKSYETGVYNGYPLSEELKLYIDACTGRDIPKDKDEGIISLLHFLSNKNNWKYFDYTAEKCIKTSDMIFPYLNRKDADAISSNTTKLFIARYVFDALGFKHNYDSIAFNDTNKENLDLDSIAFNDTNKENLDSITFINKYSNKYWAEVMITGRTKSNKNIRELLGTAYQIISITNKLKESNSVNATELITYIIVISNFVINPTVDNISIIQKEFIPKSSDNIIWKSIIILLISILIGYVLFMIILLNFFNKKSLEPNPMLSQNDLKNQKDEINRLRIDLNSELLIIDKLKKDSKDKDNKLREIEREKYNLQRQIDELNKNNDSI
jgi:hypothetical protein